MAQCYHIPVTVTVLYTNPDIYRVYCMSIMCACVSGQALSQHLLFRVHFILLIVSLTEVSSTDDSVSQYFKDTFLL